MFGPGGALLGVMAPTVTTAEAVWALAAGMIDEIDPTPGLN